MEKLHVFHHREIAHSPSFLKNKRGITITELLVVLGLIGFVAIGNATFLFDFTNQLKKITGTSDGESELSTLSIASVNILKKSAVSFNKLYLLEDPLKDGSAQNNFFDYFPDVPFAILQGVKTDYEKRTFTLTAGQKDRYFYLLQSEEADHDSLIYDPMFAYSTEGNVTNQMDSGKIRYAGLNSIPNLQGSSGAAANGTMSQVFQKRWTPGTLFLLSCPTYLRPIASDNTVNILTPPRFASFLGKVGGTDLLPSTSAELKVAFYNSSPQITPTNNYDSVDEFMKNLPAIGGAAPFVKIEPVKMVRFEIRLNSSKGTYDLILQEFSQGQYKDKVTLISEIKKVIFKRESIALPIISMEVER